MCLMVEYLPSLCKAEFSPPNPTHTQRQSNRETERETHTQIENCKLHFIILLIPCVLTVVSFLPAFCSLESGELRGLPILQHKVHGDCRNNCLPYHTPLL